MGVIGRVHSFQSLGAVDGPGIRYVIFLQGCPYRCPWCHNPDTRSFDGGEEYTPAQLVTRVKRYKPYFAGGGGVTLSGGEPLLQQEFAAELFTLLRQEGISTALDTAGKKPDAGTEALLRETDTVLCDLKFSDEQNYRRHIGIELTDVLDFLSLCDRMGKQVIIRHVVVPTLTDQPDHIRRLSALAHSAVKQPKIELLPFRKLCQEKYDRLHLPFPAAHLPECSPATVKALEQYL